MVKAPLWGTFTHLPHGQGEEQSAAYQSPIPLHRREMERCPPLSPPCSPSRGAPPCPALLSPVLQQRWQLEPEPVPPPSPIPSTPSNCRAKCPKHFIPGSGGGERELICWHGSAPIHPACSSGGDGWDRANTNEAAKTNILSVLTKVSFY